MQSTSKLLVEQRYQKILELMQADGSIRVAELKARMGVSSETIRRDLEKYGTPPSDSPYKRRRFFKYPSETKPQKGNESYIPFGSREKENTEYKSEIAELAANFIKEGQSIALDSGSTSLELARVIKKRFSSLTVVTNSYAVMNELADAKGLTLIATGGIYRPEERALVSDMAGMIFSKLTIDTFFLTTCGISADRGITYQRMDEIIVQEKMMEASNETIVIADSSKLGVNSLVKMCDIDQINMIITDSAATKQDMEPFVRAGIRVEKPEGENHIIR